jgi:N-acetyl-gamma-glutamylphosphate reductase
VQRERPRLRRAEAPAPFRDRGTALPRRREPVTIQFTPHLIPVNRGIHTTLYLAPDGTLQRPGGHRGVRRKSRGLLPRAYADEPFVRLLEGKALPDTKNVVGTNVVEIAWRSIRAPAGSSS